MKIGLVGFPGSGRSTVFGALTGLPVETGYGGRRDKANIGVVKVPEPRAAAVAEILKPKNTWKDKAAFDATTAKLAKLFDDNLATFADEGTVSPALREAGLKPPA